MRMYKIRQHYDLWLQYCLLLAADQKYMLHFDSNPLVIAYGLEGCYITLSTRI